MDFNYSISAIFSAMASYMCSAAARHGLGHWDQLAGDLRLGLGAKLEAAATEKRGKNYEAPEDHKLLPKGARTVHQPAFFHTVHRHTHHCELLQSKLARAGASGFPQ